MKRTVPVLGLVFATTVALSACGGLGSTTTDSNADTAQIPELKPDQQVSIVFESYNYGLAGAWTDTGWPATMEGAVRSGITAAHAALGARTREAVAA